MSKITTIEVKVLDIRYPREGQDNPRNWFCLSTDQGSVTGNMKWRPQQGECLRLTGEWGEYKGMKSFKFKEAMLNVPVESKSQLVYVTERTKGLGPALSEKIWDKLGDNWKDITTEDAKTLKIRPAILEHFKEQIANLEMDKEKADTISFLMSKGCTSGMAAAAWETWEKNAIGIVNENCYRLAELPHYGFTNVDGEVRKNYGIEDHDERRLKAAVVYSMQKLTSSGSTVISWNNLCKQLCAMSVNLQLAANVIAKMFDEFTIRAFRTENKISLKNHYEAEIAIMDFVFAKTA